MNDLRREAERQVDGLPINRYGAVAKPSGKFSVMRIGYFGCSPTDCRDFDTFEDAVQIHEPQFSYPKLVSLKQNFIYTQKEHLTIYSSQKFGFFKGLMIALPASFLIWAILFLGIKSFFLT